MAWFMIRIVILVGWGMFLKNELVAFSCSFCPNAGVQNVGKVENESSCSMLTC